jgi:acyl-CoA thioester hydrolase
MECSIEIPVRFGDTDPYGVVYFASYFRWAHAGIEEFLRRCGLPPEETFRSSEPRFGLPVVESAGRFIAPARYGDKLRLTVRIASLEEKAVAFSCIFESQDGGKTVAEASVKCLAISADWKAIAIPEEVRRRLSAGDEDGEVILPGGPCRPL